MEAKNSGSRREAGPQAIAWGSCGVPYLDGGNPGVGIGVLLLAVGAHVGFDDILDHKGLLQDGAVEDLGLHGDLHLEAARVRLCPDETRIHQLHLKKTGGLRGGFSHASTMKHRCELGAAVLPFGGLCVGLQKGPLPPFAR